MAGRGGGERRTDHLGLDTSHQLCSQAALTFAEGTSGMPSSCLYSWASVFAEELHVGVMASLKQLCNGEAAYPLPPTPNRWSGAE